MKEIKLHKINSFGAAVIANYDESMKGKHIIVHDKILGLKIFGYIVDSHMYVTLKSNMDFYDSHKISRFFYINTDVYLVDKKEVGVYLL
jgi:hypothetical protein